MEIAKLILEYCKVIFSLPVVVCVISIVFLFWFKEDIKALLLRIAKIKLPGGAEVSTSQSERQVEGNSAESKPLPVPEITLPGLPQDLTPQQRTVVENLLKSERAAAYLWEYRFLNYFLVYKTQIVLDWLVSLGKATSFSNFDAIWLPLIPSAKERSAIVGALETHHLIQINDNAIQITPKGMEYQQWRGRLPEPQVAAAASNR